MTRVSGKNICKEHDTPEECKKISNIKYTGPGLWAAMHSMAGKCNDEADKICFVKYVRLLIDTMGCIWCRDHAREYVSENPLRASWDHLFKWSVVFHNSVNSRLGKRIVSLEDAVKMYIGEDGICTADCDETIPPVTFDQSVKKSNQVTFTQLPEKKSSQITLRAPTKKKSVQETKKQLVIPGTQRVPTFRIISS
jgi:hypothetical protein